MIMDADAMDQEFYGQKNNFAENILTLRRRLAMTQREFIDSYLAGENGAGLISVSTLSGIENGVQNISGQLIASIAEKLEVDANVFGMDPDSFAKNIELFFKALKDKQDNARESAQQGYSINSLVRTLSEYLTDCIINGKLKPGDKLPSDRALSAEYGVGRSLIREALKVLSALGLITILPGQGTFIAGEHTDFFQTPLTWTLLIGNKDIAHLLEMRRLLETETAGLAAQRADIDALSELEAQYIKMHEAYNASDFRAFLDTDLNFHLSIARCSGNPIFYRLLQTSRKVIANISGSGMMTIDELREVSEEHSDIYDAIIKKDAKLAREMMQTHLARSAKRYRILPE